jgi:hypothetical protein
VTYTGRCFSTSVPRQKSTYAIVGCLFWRRQYSAAAHLSTVPLPPLAKGTAIRTGLESRHWGYIWRSDRWGAERRESVVRPLCGRLIGSMGAFGTELFRARPILSMMNTLISNTSQRRGDGERIAKYGHSTLCLRPDLCAITISQIAICLLVCVRLHIQASTKAVYSSSIASLLSTKNVRGVRTQRKEQIRHC